MSSINSTRNLQILYFNRKKKEILKLKNGRKSALKPPFIDTTVTNCLCYTFSSFTFRCINKENK